MLNQPLSRTSFVHYRSGDEILKQIETLFQAGTAVGLTDGQLLELFVQRRDETAEAAFAALVDGMARWSSGLPPGSGRRTRRPGCFAGHVPDPGPPGRFDRPPRVGGKLAARRRAAGRGQGTAGQPRRRRARERRGVRSWRPARGPKRSRGRRGQERVALLHDELGRLPESFREPLVLCYLEGLTQEQAAAQLRCPLGTVQSRLARGRAKLKSRLTKRGFESSAILAAVGSGAQQLLARSRRLGRGNGSAGDAVRSSKRLECNSRIGGFGRGGLAGDDLDQTEGAFGAFICAAILVTGMATWGRQEPSSNFPRRRDQSRDSSRKPQPAPAAQKPLERIRKSMCPLRRVVRDEFGRLRWPRRGLAGQFRIRDDVWKPCPAKLIRERQEPFRDHHGKVVPPASLGKYFELHDGRGNWQPIHPHDIRRHDPDGHLGETVNLDELVRPPDT